MQLSKTDEWLIGESGPKMLLESLKLVGTIETPGKGNNPTILAWADEVGGKVEDVYTADEIPWCGLVHAVIALRAEKALPIDPLWALNWGTFGKAVPIAMVGDTLCFIRRTPEGRKAGHVALYVGENKLNYRILGGNQGDEHGFAWMPKTRLYAIRRPLYKIQPPTIRQVFLNASGPVSTNEQ